VADRKQMHAKYQSQNITGRDLGVDGRIILKHVLEK
jgi:hypothetical protein